MKRPYLALCDAGHDEVCYSQDVECPVCNMRDDLESQIEDLEEDLRKAEDTIKDLESEPAEDE